MEVVWRQVALDTLETARRFIARDNPAAADRVYTRIVSAIGHLADFPELGRVGRVAGTRELVVSGTPYIVAYAIASNQVVVLAVQHAAQRWPVQF